MTSGQEGLAARMLGVQCGCPKIDYRDAPTNAVANARAFAESADPPSGVSIRHGRAGLEQPVQSDQRGRAVRGRTAPASHTPRDLAVRGDEVLGERDQTQA